MSELLHLGVQAGFTSGMVPDRRAGGSCPPIVHVVGPRDMGGRARGMPLVAAGGQFEKGQEPPLAAMEEWLQAQGVQDLIPREHIRRAYLAFSRCPFGDKVSAAAKVRFFRKLAPLVSHLAIQ